MLFMKEIFSLVLEAFMPSFEKLNMKRISNVLCTIEMVGIVTILVAVQCVVC